MNQRAVAACCGILFLCLLALGAASLYLTYSMEQCVQAVLRAHDDHTSVWEAVERCQRKP